MGFGADHQIKKNLKIKCGLVEPHFLLISHPAFLNMIIHHSRSLHVRINNGGAQKLETAFL